MSNSATLPSLNGTGPRGGVAVRRNYKWWHEAIIDDMIAFPLDSLKDRGGRLGYAPAYLSTLINSDMFKLFYQQRKAAHADLLTTSLVEKTAQVAGKTLDLMLESLEQKRTAIPFAVLADTAQKSLATLGYGIKPAPGTVVNVQQNNVQSMPPVTREQLADARSALMRSEQARVIEHRPSPAEGGSADQRSDLGGSALLSQAATKTQEVVDAARLERPGDQSGEG